MAQLPGLTQGVTFTDRDPMLTRTGMVELPGGIVLDGTNGNDFANTYTYDIRAGWPLGKITSSGLYVPCKRTTTTAAGSASTSLAVTNAAAFKAGDSIVVGPNAAQAIVSISGNTITLTSAISWGKGDVVRANDGSETCRGYLLNFARLRNHDNSAAANIPAQLAIGGWLNASYLLGDTDAIWSDPESLKYLKLLALSGDQSQYAETGLVTASFVYPATPVDHPFFIAPRRMVVRNIDLRVLVVGSDAGAVTAVAKKAPSGTAIASGTALHSGSFDLKGTANANQTVTLSTTASDLQLAVGDCLGLDVTGTTTAAQGVVTVTMVPN